MNARTLFAIVLALAAAGAQAQQALATSVPLLQPLPGLYTAGQPAPTDWAAIKALGVRTVVNLRTEGEMQGRDEAAEVRAAGMRYVSIPVAGAAGIDAARADALAAVLRDARGPVLVHCASGNRAGGLLALEQARTGAMTAEQALAFGRSAGMTSTEARLRSLLEGEDARCRLVAGQAGDSSRPEGCP